MYPQPHLAKPDQAPDAADVALHQEFAAHPRARALVKQLASESEALVTTLLNDFEALDETQIKVVLQRIKTQRNILKCLTTPVPLPK